MSATSLPRYAGRRTSSDDHQYYPEPEALKPNYLPSEPLIEVVNMAIQLGRPLLLEGEPGCGKTTLARHVAWCIDAPYHEVHVKSTGKARDALYRFDTVRRLGDAQLAQALPAARARLENPREYVTFGPLGRAFLETKRPAVVLIDEVDKADTDYPNDLLLELDRMEFHIPETEPSDEPYRARLKPLVIITSNREKELPPAFLRRCLYHYIEFPRTSEDLKRIVEVHDLRLSSAFLDAALVRFLELRDELSRPGSSVSKLPDVAELLDWLRALREFGDSIGPQDLETSLPASYALLKSRRDRSSLA